MKFLNTVLLFSIGLLLASCGNWVEEINLEEDGSGSYKVYTDIIPSSVQMATEMTMMFAAMDTTKTIDKDSLRLAVTEKVWEDFPDEIDSVIDLASEMPDSILNYKDNKKYLDKMTGFMTGGRDKGYVNMGVDYGFENQEDLMGFLKFFETVQESQSSNSSKSPMDDLTKTKAHAEYDISTKKFTRKVTYENPQTDLSDQSEFEKLFGKGKYITVINTKRKIKTAKGDHLKEVSDYKVVFEYDFLPALTGGLNTNFEIIFE